MTGSRDAEEHQSTTVRTATAWDGAWYLVRGGATALLALPLAVLVTISTIATVVLLGGALLLVLLPAARWLAGTQRRRTGAWTGRPVPQLYSSPTGTLVTRVETMLRDPATWRDLLWLWATVPVGLLGLLLCWVPFVAPRLARLQAGLSRSLLSPTGGALRRQRADLSASVTGHGLVGMRERVTVLGGSLTAGPLPAGGFRVVAELPLPATQPAAAAADPLAQ